MEGGYLENDGMRKRIWELKPLFEIFLMSSSKELDRNLVRYLHRKRNVELEGRARMLRRLVLRLKRKGERLEYE